MLSKTKGVILYGLEGLIVDVEADISNGMPCWKIVGLADANIKESKERVRTAIKNCNINLPSKKYIINLSPANIRKNGGFLDLSIAIAILKSMNYINKKSLEDIVFIGELSLDGKIGKVNGILPMCVSLSKKGIKEIIIPKENEKEASAICDLKVIGVSNLQECVNYLNRKLKIKEVEKITKLVKKECIEEIDFFDVKGQKIAKRALEISAAGGHNCLLIGSPGSGKTMMAQRMTTILPDLTLKESLEITKIHSVLGKLEEDGLICKRPFRNPHHSITEVALIGGGKNPKPGEVSLAHLGVLFLDELLEFKKNTLEAMRIPLEERKINISRSNLNVTYPCNFILIGSMNPCPCGYYGSKEKKCICTVAQIKRYRARLSNPLLDRFDIQIYVPSVKYKQLRKTNVESSNKIKERVNKARRIQEKRYENNNIYSNSELSPKLISKYCKIDKDSEKILENAMNQMKLTSRAYSKILKVARTIADLDGKEDILSKHILEAIQYRKLDKL